MSDVSSEVNGLVTPSSSGSMLLERVLQETLRFGFQAVSSDPTLVDDVLIKLSDAARADIKGYFDSREVAVHLNFPQDYIKYPMLAILNADDNEREDLDMLGDYMGSTESFVSGTTRAQALGHALSSRDQVFCMAGRDSNATLGLYYLSTAILMLNRSTLHQQGAMNVRFGGNDIAFREDLMPEMTYARMLSVTCENYFLIGSTERVARHLCINLTADGTSFP